MARRPCSSRRLRRPSSRRRSPGRPASKTAVLNPLEGLSSEESDRGRRLLHRDAGKPRSAARGSRMSVTDPASVPAVSLDGVSFSYRGGPVALEGVTLEIGQGEFVGIAGPNGGGKTTLLRLALGLEQPDRGEVLLFGRSPVARGGPRIGYLPQRAHVAAGAPVTVREVVSAGRLAVRGPVGPLRARDRTIVASAIDRVGLASRADAPLRTLSGGSAAAGVHRQGAGDRARPACARRADDGRRRGVAGLACGAPEGAARRARGHHSLRLARVRRGRARRLPAAA